MGVFYQVVVFPVNSLRKSKVLWHSGGLFGISTLIGLLPDDGIGVVILINSSGKGPESDKIMYRVVDDILGLHTKPEEPLDDISM